MSATEIGMVELLPLKRCNKNKFNCIGASEETLINTYILITEWWTLRIHRA